jgi:type I restriction enzyme, S subunit
MIEFVLSDIFDLQQGFAFKSKDFLPEGVPILKIKNVKSSGVSLHQLDYVNEAFLDTHGKYIPDHGDALISMSGNRLNGSKETWVGKVALFKEEATFLVNQRVGILKNKIPQEANTGFLVYALSSDYWQLRFAQTATSSGGQANLSTSQILSESVFLPSLPDQKAIAHILGTLDDKIELNQKMNQTFEDIAKAIFKSWFVDFDPVRAKMEGRPTGLPPEIDELFPDALVDSEIGEIPKGWEVKTISDLADCVGGATPSTKNPEFWEGGEHTWTSPKDLSDSKSIHLLKTDRKITEAGLKKISSGLLPVGTVLLSSRAPVGYLALTTEPTAINQGYIALKPKNGISNYFLLHWCESNLEEIKNRASGTTFAEISKAAFRPIPAVEPSNSAMEKFHHFVSPIYERVLVASKEMETLSELRDTLLPKLISGELRIPDAEKFLEEAGI